jgi:hypothetical protein
VRLLVSGATDTLRRLAPQDGDVLGCLPVPGGGNDPKSLQSLGLPIAADNGCFNGLNADKFVRMLNAFREAGVPLEWVAVPDKVADGDETFRLWGRWEPVVRAFGFRPCLVLQDGMTRFDVHQFDPPALFIGGTTGFKLGTLAASVTADWRAKGRPVHMGRVNSRDRIRYAVEIGCTSCDGSGFSKWPDTRIPLGVRWIREAMSRTRHRAKTLSLF